MRTAGIPLAAAATLAGCALVTDARQDKRLDPDGDGVEWPDDCDDHDATVGLPTPWYPDDDRDLYGLDSGAVTACEAPAGHATAGGDCDDTDPEVHPEATESCNGTDDDCDGVVDQGLDFTDWYADIDEDGYGDDDVVVTDCAQPSGYLALGGDCDDDNAAVYPDATEVCNGIDDDCDVVIDEEGEEVEWYADADGDTFGDPDAVELACSPPEGYVGDWSDCDDTDPAVNPDATETWYDGVDQDCAGDDDYDADADGWESDLHGGLDCDDTDPLRYPGATVWQVPGDAATVQGAVDLACTYDRIEVTAGTYAEDIVVEGLTLEIVAVDGAEWTELSGTGAGSVVTLDGVDDLVLEGFTITGGLAADGGGVWVGGSDGVVLSGLVVDGNTATGDGGGVYVETTDEIAVEGCAFTGNSAGDSGGGFAAHGTSTGGGSTFEISRSTFSGNEAAADGGGLYIDGAAETTIARVEATGNESFTGGGAYLAAGAGGTIQAANLVVVDNDRIGLYLRVDDATAAMAIANATIAGNGGSGIGVEYGAEGVVELTNVLSAWNETWGLNRTSGAAEVTVAYSDVYGNGSGEYSGFTDVTGSSGNLSEDPEVILHDALQDAGNWNLHLRPGSPLVDGGDPSITDPDGSTSDVGAWGGPDADVSYYDDADGDGMYDEWETENGLDPLTDDSGDDPDGDDLDNAGELWEGTDPHEADADRDGQPDGMEVANGTDPLEADPYPFEVSLTGQIGSGAAGGAAAMGGDVDGDGVDDVVAGETGTGVAYVVSGPVTASSTLFDAATGAVTGMSLAGDGHAIAAAGDVNGDGYHDLVFGDWNANGAGAAWLLIGPVTGFDPAADIAVGELDAAGSGEQAGWAVAAGRDASGDGVPDYVVGAPAAGAGTLYVVHGPLSGVESLGAAEGTFSAASPGDEAGKVVAFAGDVDSDGLADVLAGVPKNDAAGADAGSTFLFLGPATGTASLGGADAVVRGAAAADGLGAAVATAGDVDGDGKGDVLIGAPDAAGGDGTAWLFLGPLTGILGESDADAVISGTDAGIAAGAALAGMGDADGDGNAELAVGAPEAESGAGTVFLYYGPLTGSVGTAEADALIVGSTAGAALGTLLAGGGDPDGDGVPDLLIGAPQDGSSGQGAALLLFGGSL